MKRPLRNNSHRLLVLTAAGLLFVLVFSFAGTGAAYAYDAEEQAFLTLINNYRAGYGLPALTASYNLTTASEWFSTDMATYNYFPFSHVSRDGRTFDQRIRDAGYTYNTWLGENIAAGYTSAQSVFDAWRNSPSHNTNMLSANYLAIGIGRAYNAGSTYGWYWTTDFGGVAESNAPPAVSYTRPANNGMVYVNSSIRATFNKQIDAGTISSSSFSLIRNSDGAPVSAQVDYISSSMTAALLPNTPLQAGSSYTATLTTAITDILGNPLSSQYQWSFTATNYLPPYFSWFDYGSTSTGLMLFESASGFVPYPIWYSGAGNWEGSRTMTTMADKVNDDLPELYSFYNYGGSSAGLFVFDPASFPEYEPQQRWASCAGCWDFTRTKTVTAADQLGKNVSEVITMYNYGGDNTGVFTFNTSNGSDTRVYISGPGNWDFSRSKVLAAANYDGDATIEIAVLYDYGNANTGIFVFDPDAWGPPGYVPDRVFLSGPGNLEFPRSKVTVADQDNDGMGEIVLLYNYGNANTGLFLFEPDSWNNPGYTPNRVWLSGAGNWDWSRSNLLSSADQDSDGRTENAILYNYGNAASALFLLDPASTPTPYAPAQVWNSGAGGFDWNRARPI